MEQGLLPYDSIPRVWGGPGNGETCDGCDLMIPPTELLIEGIALSGDGENAFNATDRRVPLQLHVTCFYVWDQERRK
jgi:hypothetical protein